MALRTIHSLNIYGAPLSVVRRLSLLLWCREGPLAIPMMAALPLPGTQSHPLAAHRHVYAHTIQGTVRVALSPFYQRDREGFLDAVAQSEEGEQKRPRPACIIRRLRGSDCWLRKRQGSSMARPPAGSEPGSLPRAPAQPKEGQHLEVGDPGEDRG